LEEREKAKVRDTITIYHVWRHLELRGKPSSKCRSPFRPDRNPSFSVSEDGKLFNDFAEPNHKGDVFKFYALAKPCEIGEAIRALGVWAGLRKDDGPGRSLAAPRPILELEPIATTPREPGEPEPELQLTDENRQAITNAIEALKANPDAIAKWRHWSRETVLKLSSEGVLGLWEGDSPAFIFERGLKARTKATGKAKRVWWPVKVPQATSLWRGHLLRPEHQRVFITAGEPDAITLIDSGIEADGPTFVVALSGETYDIKRSGELVQFKGRDVVLVADLDTAGITSFRKNLSYLAGVAKSVCCLNVAYSHAVVDIKDITDLRDARGGLTVEEIERWCFRADIGYRFVSKWRQLGGFFSNWVKRTLATLAQESGEPLTAVEVLERKVLLLPSDYTEIRDSAEAAAKVLSRTHKFFVREGKLLRLVDDHGKYSLADVKSEGFQSKLEDYFILQKHYADRNWQTIAETNALLDGTRKGANCVHG
jgi:hypothetical protein